MKFLGLVPSEYSSGQRRHQGGITKTGNTHARRVLVEGAWAYRYPAKVSRQFRDATFVLQQYKTEGLLPPTIIVHMGTSGAFSDTVTGPTSMGQLALGC